MGYVTVWEGKWESLESEKCVWKGSLKHFWPICIVKHPPLPPPPFTHESGMMAELLERRTLVAYQLMPRGPTSAKDKYGGSLISAFTAICWSSHSYAVAPTFTNSSKSCVHSKWKYEREWDMIFDQLKYLTRDILHQRKTRWKVTTTLVAFCSFFCVNLLLLIFAPCDTFDISLWIHWCNW